MKSWLAIALLMFACAAWAIDSAPAFEDPQMQQRYMSLIRELRCVQCRNQSIADSPITLAADLRRQVRELMQQGRSDQEILTYMTDRYGNYILFNPPLVSQTWLLWSAPVLLLLIGGISAGVFIVRKSRQAPDDVIEPERGPDTP